eukprot:g5963.t1
MLRRVYPLYLRIKKIFVKTSTIRALMIGDSGSGKTTLCRVLEGKEVRLRSVDPTYGLTIRPVTVKYDGTFDKVKSKKKKRKMRKQSVMIWDFGGSRNQEKSWPMYFLGTDIFIFVIDSSRRKYVEKASKLLDNVLAFFPPHIPILFLANKQDSQFALPVKEVETIMELNEKVKERVWRIFPSNSYPKRVVNPNFKPGVFRSRFEERLRRGMSSKKVKSKKKGMKKDVESLKVEDTKRESLKVEDAKRESQDEDLEDTKSENVDESSKVSSKVEDIKREEQEEVENTEKSNPETSVENTEKSTPETSEESTPETSTENTEESTSKQDEEDMKIPEEYYLDEDEKEMDDTNKLPPLAQGKQHVTTFPNGVDDAMNWLVSAVREFRCDEELQMKLRFHEEMEAEKEKEKKKREAQERKANKKVHDKKAHEKYGMRRFVGAGDDETFEELKKEDTTTTKGDEEEEEDDVVEQTFEMEQ